MLFFPKKENVQRKSLSPAESTLARQIMRKKVDPLVRANSAGVSSDCLALTEFTRLGEQKCLFGVKFSRLGGRTYHRRKVTRLGGLPY